MRDQLYSGFAGPCLMAPCRHGRPPVVAVDAFGWTSTAGLAGVSVDAQPATVFQQGEWTAKGFSVPAGQHTFQVVRTAQNQTQATAQATVTRPALRPTALSGDTTPPPTTDQPYRAL
jgi:hypothetical protein